MSKLSSQQAEYERFHTPEARAARLQEAVQARESATGVACGLFTQGDIAGARQVLFDAGICDAGISEYLHLWSS